MSKRVLLVPLLLIALGCFADLTIAQTAAGTARQPATTFKQLVMDIQRMLTELGYRPGPVDGSYGKRTRQAIQRYQSNTRIPVDGHPSESLRQHLFVATGAAAPGSASAAASSGAGADTPLRKAAWQGLTMTDALLRIAPSGASASRQQLDEGTELEVLRRQGAWLEVRVKGSRSEGWVKQVSVRAVEQSAAAAPKKESGGFFANLARGVSRLLGGSSDAPQNQGSVTVGIRGLTPEDLTSAIPDPAELDKMEGFRADRDQAFRFAGEEHLTAQTVEYIVEVEPASSGPATSGGRDN